MPSEAERFARARVLMQKKVLVETGEDGAPVRIIPRRGHRKPLGRYASLKAKRALMWESLHERHLMWLCEADTNVISFSAQSHKMKSLKPDDFIYTPDIVRVLADGTREIIEVKRRRDEVSKDPDYEEKLRKVEQYYTLKGYSFRILTAQDDIEVEPIFSNAKTIKTDRFTRYETIDVLRFREAIHAAGGGLTYARATEILSETSERDDPLARAKLHAMIVRRVASVDIRLKLWRDSLVTEIEGRRTFRPKKAA